MDGNIVVIGSSNVDMIMKMHTLPSEGETITNATFQQVFGGKGANQAVAAARAGGKVTFVNCVGKIDPYHPKMINNFEEDGINTNFIYKCDNVASGHALVMIGDDGKNYLSVAPGANYMLTPDLIDKSLSAISSADIILLQFEIPLKTIEYILSIAEEKDIPILWNMAPAQPFDTSILQKVKFFVVNESEASFITGKKVNTIDSAKKACQELALLGPKIVIVTLGAQGVVYNLNDETHFIPAFKVIAEDTTAAGDVFCGSFAVALTENKRIEDAIRFATAASALSVQKIGAQPSIPMRKAIDDFLNA
ncbi:ribokinase [Galbibacter mesophilus]|uniref:ribokinase n=1 Tax=Galbibacter mesophilus TaxID=379069 RepID=UPI00191D8CE4|nr:ribokinase [Galbibacter mesophilus]MCM5663286.1 ribokinase [Galbibacter mesophilus]